MIDQKITIEDEYKLLVQQIESLINPNDPTVTNLANITAAIKQTFPKISWVGFYIAKSNKLFLGPFQGKVACTKIDFGKGVCGSVAQTGKTLVVENVHEFPGHIACDVESNSEIVIPLTKMDEVIAVLDLDSKEFSVFNEIDKIWLEKICNLISTKLTFNKNILE
jgi:GAF domain-containing protein